MSLCRPSFEEYVQNNILSNVGNLFDVSQMAEKVTKALEDKTPDVLYLGFNPVNYRSDIVVHTNKGYIFVPLDDHLELAGGVWSSHVFLRLFFAQERLSHFLSELGKALKIPVVDRGLYAAYLDSEIFQHEDMQYYSHEEINFCLAKQNAFRQTYKQQLNELRQFKSWTQYHNQGFEYRYIPSIEVNKAINEIYHHRKVLEENSYWTEARKVIDRLYDLVSNP